MIADYEDLQESENLINSRQQIQKPEVFVKGDHEFPCANETLDFVIVQDRLC